MKHDLIKIVLYCCIAALLPGGNAFAQLLQKRISVEITGKPLQDALQQIGRQGNFTFSYNSKVIPGNKTVQLSVRDKPVKEILDVLLEGSCQYKEEKGHIILQPAREKWYTLSGYVLDAASGERISNASVYERQQLVATLTNDQGFFKLRLRDKYPTAAITISKEWYTDTSLVFAAGGEQLCNVPVRPIRNIQMDSVTVTPNRPQSSNISSTWLGKFFLSSRQKVQALNISRFIANRPYQVSLIPGLGTHGNFSGQVVNKVSLNILGGYTAGTRGAEVGGLFNISKQEVKGTQVAGVFNMVGGSTNGAQIAGVYNASQDSVTGVQVAGVINTIAGSSKGVIIAGVLNKVKKNSSGTHIAGVANIDQGAFTGVQVAGVFNYARRLKGVQIGVVNIADTMDGYSIGLVNLSRNGYHKVSIFSTETLPVNVAIKTGNDKLYSLLLGGMDAGDDNKAYSFGIGFGHCFRWTKRVSFTAEATVQHIYLGTWDYSNMMYRFQGAIQYRVNKYITVYCGTSLVGFDSEQPAPVAGYKRGLGDVNTGFDVDGDMKEWVGWHAGITFF